MPRWVVLSSLLVTLIALAGCSSPPAAGTVAGAPVAPAEPQLSTPESAVRSYLEWVSFSYRMANSDIPSQTMTPWEGVRVDSYIQLNREKGLGIEQRLVVFEPGATSVEGTGAVVPAYEEWVYRYFSLDSLAYTSVEATASYDATYTLVQEAGKWLVDKVEATPRAPLKAP